MLSVGVLYLVVTVLGAVDGHDVLGVIPVDMRDKIVHPLIAASALVVVAWERRQRLTRASTTA